MAINAIGNGIPFPRGEGIPSAVRDSMVLWYDLKRQGATNETMAANPKLIDLSGNGHDATCYNFAWNFDSGVRSKQITFADFNSDNVTVLDLYTDADGRNNVAAQDKNYREVTIAYNKRKNNTDSFKIRITNYNSELFHYIAYFYRGIDGVEHWITMTNNGYYVLPISYNLIEGSGTSNGFGIYFKDSSAVIKHTFAATIEILPIEYPNALMADGVDDYAMVEELSLLTDYTVIAKRKRLDIDLKRRGTLSSKLTNDNKNGAFAFEYIQGNTGIQFEYSFGINTPINHVDTDISYMTKNSYNGMYIIVGTAIDTDFLTLFSTRENQGLASAALYSFILFNRTLTTKEINWVKHNLIEGDTEL